MLTWLALYDNKADDDQFWLILPSIKREFRDTINYVKEAVNWSLRQIGKCNLNLNWAPTEMGHLIHVADSQIARLMSIDALRKLADEETEKKLDR